MTQQSISELTKHIEDGASLAISKSVSGPAIAATQSIIQQAVRDLHLITIPTAGIQADMLIGAGCVASVETAGITLDEHGHAGRFIAAVKSGSINLKDTTCPAIISALQAGEKGVPFLPMRGLIGSDLLKNRADYKVIENPIAEGGDPIVALPAIVPDFALFHAPLADDFGNVWIGKNRELMTMAHAAKHCLVTVEKVVDFDLMQDSLYSPATIPEMFISSIAVAENGAWPLGLEGFYKPDDVALAIYATAAKTKQGFDNYLSENSGQAAE